MFENKIINNYAHASRFIASWIRAGGDLRTGKDLSNFHKWLLSIGVEKDDADYIKFLAENGKLELQNNAKDFLNKLKTN